MKQQTRIAFNNYKLQLAELNGIDNVAEKFSVSPQPEQIMESKMQESSAFLQSVNMIGVDNQQGEKLGLGMGSTIAGTTDTTVQDRETQDPTTLDKVGYLATQTNFDVHMTYAKMDAWAHMVDFQQRMRDQVITRSALDRIMIGWNGTSRAVTSNRGTNPLLQDVNIGWLEKARVNKAASVMTDGAAAGAINIGDIAGGDYKNLDALVFDAVNNLLDPWYTEDSGLVVILGRELMADKYFPLINDHSNTPTEANALDLRLSAKRVGGLQAATVPFFPARSLAITRLDNLSVYWQIGSRRRTIIERAERDRIEDFNSVNEAYVIEDHGGFCAVENIKLPNAAGDAFE